MSVLLVTFLVAAILALLIVRAAHSHAHRAHLHGADKPQRLHAHPVPRIGGAAIVMALLVGAAWLQWHGEVEAAWTLATLLACAAPAFLVGIVQDWSDAVSPRGRLLATSVSATIAFWWLEAGIHETSIPGLDWVVATTVGALAVTVFAVAGIANAMNIIDGLNGLASMCVLLMLLALAYAAFQTDDAAIATLALAIAGAVLGFFVFNYPAGLIFLGDGGAYFLGFMVSEVSILLLVRNEEVSPLFPLLVCIYPAFETVFSIYRRWILRETSPMLPDGIHLHSLLYRRLMRWAVGPKGARALLHANSRTSPYLWLLCMLSVLPAMVFWDNTAVLAIFILLFAMAYVWLYWSIVRFRTPRWLVARRKAGASAPET